MKLKYSFVLQEVEDGFVAVATGNNAAGFQGLIRLNKTGACLMEHLQNETTEDGLVEKLLDRFEVTEKNAREAVREFVRQLTEEDLLDI